MAWVWVFLANNDHRSGSFAGRCEAAHIGAGRADQELCSLEGPHLAVRRDAQRRTLTVAGATYRYRALWDWAGNWCWTGYLLTARDAARLLARLRGRGYRPDCAPVGFWGAWTGRRALTARLAAAYGGVAAGAVFARRQRRFNGRTPQPPTWRARRPYRSLRRAA